VAHGFRRVRHLHLCNLLFDPEKVMWTTPQVRNLTGFQALFVLAPYYRKQKEFRPHLQLPPADLQAVMETIRTMEGELQQRATGYESMVQALFLRLIVILCRCYALAPPAETHILRLAEVLSHLEVHYRDALNMDDLARHARLSRRHFARVFRRHYGTSPMDYVIRLRLQHACRLLRRGDCTISEAAFASGFEDSNYFARLFRRRLGLSPRAWRTGDRQAENDAPTAR
jgi:AraC-like DNA-binding protein